SRRNNLPAWRHAGRRRFRLCFKITSRERRRQRSRPYVFEMSDDQQKSGLVRALGPIDATMIVIGSMIGSGIFITSAESARLSGAPGWLLLAWVISGLLTMRGGFCSSGPPT